MSDDNLIRLDEVRWMLAGVSRSTIREWVQRGDMPAPIRLSAHTRVWRQSMIRDWVKRKERQTA